MKCIWCAVILWCISYFVEKGGSITTSRDRKSHYVFGKDSNGRVILGERKGGRGYYIMPDKINSLLNEGGGEVNPIIT